jgi:5,10-methylenetetrahydrofolate reductase
MYINEIFNRKILIVLNLGTNLTKPDAIRHLERAKSSGVRAILALRGGKYFL